MVTQEGSTTLQRSGHLPRFHSEKVVTGQDWNPVSDPKPTPLFDASTSGAMHVGLHSTETHHTEDPLPANSAKRTDVASFICSLSLTQKGPAMCHLGSQELGRQAAPTTFLGSDTPPSPANPPTEVHCLLSTPGFGEWSPFHSVTWRESPARASPRGPLLQASCKRCRLRAPGTHILPWVPCGSVRSQHK